MRDKYIHPSPLVEIALIDNGKKVEQSLDLQTLMPKVPDTVRERLGLVIAETLDELGGMLHCDLSVESYNPTDDHQKQTAARLNPQKLDLANRNAVIELREGFLRKVAILMQNPATRYGAEYSLRFALAHEVKHFDHMSRFPNSFRQDRLRYTRTADSWLTLRTEYAADVFAVNYIAHRSIQYPQENQGMLFILGFQRDRLDRFSSRRHFQKN